MQHAVVSHDDWLTARKALLTKELDMTHALDALRAERRQLPWVKIEKAMSLTARTAKKRWSTSSAIAASSPSITSCFLRGRIIFAQAAPTRWITSTRRGSISNRPISHLRRYRARRLSGSSR